MRRPALALFALTALALAGCGDATAETAMAPSGSPTSSASQPSSSSPAEQSSPDVTPEPSATDSAPAVDAPQSLTDEEYAQMMAEQGVIVAVPYPDALTLRTAVIDLGIECPDDTQTGASRGLYTVECTDELELGVSEDPLATQEYRTLTFRAQPPTNMVFGPNWYVETSNYMEAKMVNEALGGEIYVGPTE